MYELRAIMFGFLGNPDATTVSQLDKCVGNTEVHEVTLVFGEADEPSPPKEVVVHATVVSVMFCYGYPGYMVVHCEFNLQADPKRDRPELTEQFTAALATEGFHFVVEVMSAFVKGHLEFKPDGECSIVSGAIPPGVVRDPEVFHKACALYLGDQD